VGWFPLAFEHSKVCTLCDFGHLQFYIFLIFEYCQPFSVKFFFEFFLVIYLPQPIWGLTAKIFGV
jgi:hypothetical protein